GTAGVDLVPQLRNPVVHHRVERVVPSRDGGQVVCLQDGVVPRTHGGSKVRQLLVEPAALGSEVLRVVTGLLDRRVLLGWRRAGGRGDRGFRERFAASPPDLDVVGGRPDEPVAGPPQAFRRYGREVRVGDVRAGRSGGFARGRGRTGPRRGGARDGGGREILPGRLAQVDQGPAGYVGGV